MTRDSSGCIFLVRPYNSPLTDISHKFFIQLAESARYNNKPEKKKKREKIYFKLHVAFSTGQNKLFHIGVYTQIKQFKSLHSYACCLNGQICCIKNCI